jgi:divalent metal cation (Fe/Co/Zn/Cd) transporter
MSKLFKLALTLSLLTIGANLVEGTISTILGAQDEALALFGFGIDSFIEVLSALGVTLMILRMQKNPESSRSKAEVTALKVTGVSFYLLVVGLIVSSVLSLLFQRKPETTLPGIIISILSISVMVFLYRAKLSAGKKMQNEAIISDAYCTKTCIYMSVVLLVSSLTFTLTGFAFLDVIGALGIAWFAFSEGREAFEKASNLALEG